MTNTIQEAIALAAKADFDVPWPHKRNELVRILADLIRLQHNSEFAMQGPLARARSEWVEKNIPNHLQPELWREAIILAAKADNI